MKEFLNDIKVDQDGIDQIFLEEYSLVQIGVIKYHLDKENSLLNNVC